MADLLRQSDAQQRLVFEQAAARTGLPPTTVEKDWWVCWALRAVFTLPSLTGGLTFKGGTSLSKAWGLIDRFSEDIDLTIHRDRLGFGSLEELSSFDTASARKRQAQKLLARASAYVLGPVRDELGAKLAAAILSGRWELTPDVGDRDQQTLVLKYSSQFGRGQGRYVQPEVKLEFGARAEPTPATTRDIRSFVAEIFPAYVEPNQPIMALLPERTFWEKAALLHEETFRPASKPRRPYLARHYYDLYRLIEHGVGRRALVDDALFAAVVRHRALYFAQRWVDYATLARGSLRLLPTADQRAGWRADYAAMKPEMFRTSPPDFDAVLEAVGALEREFNVAAR